MELTRPLNGYEAMLATSTCTVGLLVTAPGAASPQALLRAAKDAWRRLRPAYAFLSARLTPPAGGAPPSYAPADVPTLDAASFVGRVRDGGGAAADGGDGARLCRRAVALGSVGPATATTLAVADVDAWAAADGTPSAGILLSLCHAASDAPGALALAHRYAALLGAVLGGGADAAAAAAAAAGGSAAGAPRPPQPLFDVQAALLAAHPGAPDDAVQFPPAVRAYADAVAGAGAGGTDASTPNVLLPTAAAGLPSDAGPARAGDPPPTTGRIEGVFWELSAASTDALRRACRAAGGTVQGALTVADLITRSAVTRTPLPVLAAAAIPVNCRPHVVPPLPADVCVCGSAAATVGVALGAGTPVGAAIRAVTTGVRAAVPRQPADWLWRLLHAPASLPAATLMDSSVGVSPLARAYGGGAVVVADTLFFGSAAGTAAAAVGTMVHAHTFDGRLHVACNATVPGVAAGWATASAAALHAAVAALADGSVDTLGELWAVAAAAAEAAGATAKPVAC